MCRLFAFSFQNSTQEEKRIQYLSIFKELSISGAVLNKNNPGHMDGWGAATYKRDTLFPSVYKSIIPASNDQEFLDKDIFKNGIPETGVVHLRKKTVGEATLPNTHPFVQEEYSFIHNGTIGTDCPYSEFSEECQGVTDSERLFRKFLAIKKSEKISTLEAYKKMITETKIAYPLYSAINTILHDGNFVYISRVINFENLQSLYKKEDIEEYYTLYIGKTKSGDNFVSSEKIAEDDIVYTSLPNNTFCVIDRSTGTETCSTL